MSPVQIVELFFFKHPSFTSLQEKYQEIIELSDEEKINLLINARHYKM